MRAKNEMKMVLTVEYNEKISTIFLEFSSGGGIFRIVCHFERPKLLYDGACGCRQVVRGDTVENKQNDELRFLAIFSEHFMFFSKFCTEFGSGFCV